MRVLFITDNFPPEVNAPAARTYEHALRWVRSGTEVTVITCTPNFPEGRVYQGYANRPRTTEMIDGIRVVRVWSYITANEGFIKRSLDYLSFALSAFFAGLFEKADVIVATSPQFFTTLAGAALSIFRRKPWIFELRDLWPESIVAVGAARNPRLIYALECIELSLYRHAARIIAVTPAFKDNLVRRGIAADKIDVITNGADLSMWRARPPAADLLAELGLQGKFVIGYIGTHGMAHGLDFIVRCAAHIDDPRIHFVFIGGGAEKTRVVELAASLGTKNITFLPSIAKQDVPHYLASTDIALVPLRRSDTFKGVIPSKIFESAAMRIPILLGVEGQAEKIIRHFGAGVCFKPEDEADFLSKLVQLSEDRTLYQTCQKGCDALAAAYDRDRLANDMLSILQKVSANSL